MPDDFLGRNRILTLKEVKDVINFSELAVVEAGLELQALVVPALGGVDLLQLLLEGHGVLLLEAGFVTDSGNPVESVEGLVRAQWPGQP